jgi:hypothetical protein
MARIRSVHPGLFTDEVFVQLSDAAQVFFIGLWTEADDQGAFEWKPVTLKMRIRPASIIPVEPLLEELEAAGCIKQYAIGGKKYGAVRNFCRFQRPKKPNSTHPIPDEFRTYTASSATGSEPDIGKRALGSPPIPLEAASVPPKVEIVPQMEDGGGKKEAKPASSVAELARGNGRQPPNPCVNDPLEAWLPLANWEFEIVNGRSGPVKRAVVGGFHLDVAARLVTEAAGINDVTWRGDWRPLIAWLTENLDLHEVILPAIRRVAERPNYIVPRSLSYFDQAVREGRAAA